MSEKACPNCGGMNPVEAKFCSFCGSELIQQPTPAPQQNFNMNMNQNRDQMGNQGYNQPPPQQTMSQPPYRPIPSTKDRVTAGILAIILGGLGIHKFYLNNIGMGILYLCFSCTGIPEIIGLIEGIIYLTENDEEFYVKHVQPYL
ncbi:MAG: NINE protein [Promethearchaeota archaeon]